MAVTLTIVVSMGSVVSVESKGLTEAELNYYKNIINTDLKKINELKNKRI